VDIATTAIDLIRVGVQVISCFRRRRSGVFGSRRAIGNRHDGGLVIGTQWFNDNIVTPNVRLLVRKYVAPHYQKLINNVLGDGLKKYHCHIADDAIPR